MGADVVNDLVVSAPTDFARETAVIALPRLNAGKTLVVKVGAVPLVELITALDGVPGANAAPDPNVTRTYAEIRDALVQSQAPAQNVAEAGLLEPKFSFATREDGKAFWGDLHPENQGFIIAQIMALSGLDKEASTQASTFPAGAAG